MTAAYIILTCTLLIKTNIFLDIVRPFHNNEIASLITSFEKWETHSPCKLQNKNNHGRKLVFWSSQKLSKKNVLDIKYVLENSQWQKCFSQILFQSADLTANEDVYSSDQNMITWNAGPNIQFYEYLAQNKHSKRLFLLVEPDTYPVSNYWLEKLERESQQQQPFAIMGTTYSGNKWDGIKNYLPLELLTHLNGNAIYNISSQLLQITLQNYDRETFLNYGHNSYDVQFAKEVIFRQMQKFYIKTSLIQNFAGSYAKKSQILPDAVLVHGLPNIESWPTSTQPLSLLVSKFDNCTINETQFNQIGIYDIVYTFKTNGALCTKAVDKIRSQWFLWLPSNVGPPPLTFETSLHKENSSLLVPIAEYVHHDSIYCKPPCREKIYDARNLFPSSDRHYESNFIAYNKKFVKKACKEIQQMPKPLNNTDLTPNMYMAYIHWLEGQKYCTDYGEPAMCSMESVAKACKEKTAVGTLVRKHCNATCADSTCRNFRIRRSDRTQIYKEYDVETYGRLPGLKSDTETLLKNTTLRCSTRDFVVDNKILEAGSCLEHPTAHQFWCPTDYGLDDTGRFVPEIGNGSWIWCDKKAGVTSSLAHIALLNFTHENNHNKIILPIVLPLGLFILGGSIWFAVHHCKQKQTQNAFIPAQFHYSVTESVHNILFDRSSTLPKENGMKF